MRRTLVALGAAVLAVALGACSSGSGSGSGDGSGNSGSASAPTNPADLKADISYAFWDQNQEPAMKQLIADFNKTYPNVKVTTEITPWAQYWTKLQTQATGKQLPDVFWMNGPNIQLYASNGQLAPLDDLVSSKAIDTANYPQALVGLYTVGDKLYGVPKDFDTIAVFYNKKIFDEAGVAYPKAGWTWQDFQTTAKTISDKLKGQGIYGVATSLTGGQEGYYNTMLQAGGFVISPDGKKSGYDDPNSIKGLQFWADLIANGSSPTLQQMSDTPVNKLFTSGKSAMYWTGTWEVSELAASSIKDDVSVVQLPKGDKQATVIHGLANVISASTPNKAAAEAFVTYLGSKEAALTQAKMGAANPAFNGTQQAFVDSVPGFNLQVFEDAATQYAVAYPVSKNTAAWNTLENNLLPDAFSGKKPVAEVAKDLADQMNALLAKE